MKYLNKLRIVRTVRKPLWLKCLFYHCCAETVESLYKYHDKTLSGRKDVRHHLLEVLIRGKWRVNLHTHCFTGNKAFTCS